MNKNSRQIKLETNSVKNRKVKMEKNCLIAQFSRHKNVPRQTSVKLLTWIRRYPTCDCELLGLAAPLYSLNGDLAHVFARVGHSGVGQQVHQVFCTADFLVVDRDAIFVDGVLPNQRLMFKNADHGPAPHSDISVPDHYFTGLQVESGGSNDKRCKDLTVFFFLRKYIQQCFEFIFLWIAL